MGQTGIKMLLPEQTESNTLYLSWRTENRNFLYMIWSEFLWHKEDNLRARDFCYHDGRLLCINDYDNKIYEMMPTEPVEEKERIEWSAELGAFDEFVEDKKIYSRLKMRLKLDDLAELTVMISVDGGELGDNRAS
ncbi:MAG: hypothetical protein ACLRYB_18190 [Segatella copri]